MRNLRNTILRLLLVAGALILPFIAYGVTEGFYRRNGQRKADAFACSQNLGTAHYLISTYAEKMDQRNGGSMNYQGFIRHGHNLFSYFGRNIRPNDPRSVEEKFKSSLICPATGQKYLLRPGKWPICPSELPGHEFKEEPGCE